MLRRDDGRQSSPEAVCREGLGEEMQPESSSIMKASPETPIDLHEDAVELLRVRLAAAEREQQSLRIENDRLKSRVAQLKSWSYRLSGLGRLLARAVHALDKRGGRSTSRRVPGARSVPQSDYQDWIAACDQLGDDDRAAMRRHIKSWPQQPMITVAITISDTAASVRLSRCITSIEEQIYEGWQLLVIHSPILAPKAQEAVRQSNVAPDRIRLTAAPDPTDFAPLREAQGDFVIRLDAGDALAPHALYVVANEILAAPDAVLIFSDEDRLTPHGVRSLPQFKTAASRDLLLARNTIGRLAAYRTVALSTVMAAPPSVDADWEWTLALRTVWRYGDRQVRHLPFVLCHRGPEFEPARGPYGRVDNALRTIEAFLRETGLRAEAAPIDGTGLIGVSWLPPSSLPPVTIVIPIRDRVDLLQRCIDGIRSRTRYPGISILVIDNGSTQSATLRFLAAIATDPNIRILRDPGPFNFAALCNRGVTAADTPIVAILNNDIDPITPDWLEVMVTHATRPDVGGVGAKLRYPDHTIQHAGILVGIGDSLAYHVHRRFSADAFGEQGRLVTTQEVSAVTGACLVLRKDVWNEAGGMDPELPVYYNDIDLCLRLRTLGYRVIWTPAAELTHLESATLGEWSASRARILDRDRARFVGKWGEAALRDPLYNPNLASGGEYALGIPGYVVPPWRSGTSTAP
jgi:GT2 family glycosyltransferase